MAATPKNEFWKLRSKHGRDKIFQSPDMLWEAAKEYFEHTSQREWLKTEFHGKDATKCNVPTQAPFLLQTLWIFIGITKTTWYEYKKLEEFKEVIARIEQIITAQKLEGALVGAYQATITSRIEGLKDISEVSVQKATPIFGSDSIE